ncbi:MAG TPA: hypothetical protein VFV38_39895 [Ktedonobacteraceae bacterium]|nr:hypothetical protein [Ktedonobacteraceae bacterium]
MKQADIPGQSRPKARSPELICNSGDLIAELRNRRATGALSPVLTLYLVPDGALYIQLQELLAQDQIQVSNLPLPITITPRRPGPKKSRHSIPSIEWPSVVRRIIDNQEPLRKVAEDYGVSHETVRRTVRAVCKRQGTG